MKRYSELQRLFFPSSVFDDILKEVQDVVSVSKIGEPYYPEFINQLLTCITESDVSILAELYSDIPETTWRNICDYGRKNYFQSLVARGDLGIERVEAAGVVLRWKIEDTRDVDSDLEDAIAAALSAGKPGRDIIKLVEKIEWRLWHE